MSRPGIVFGCIDLVVDQDNSVFFLEVNRAEQFLFVEEKVCELPLLRSMAVLLMEGGCDYSMDACEAVKLGDYLASDEYQNVLESLEAAPPSASLER